MFTFIRWKIRLPWKPKAIMNKTDNFNGYFDSLYYATDSIIYSDITQQLLQKNVTLPSPDDQSLLTDILYNYMYHSSSSYVINSWTINNPIVTLSIQNAAGDLYATSAIITQRKSVQMNYSDCWKTISLLFTDRDTYFGIPRAGVYTSFVPYITIRYPRRINFSDCFPSG